MGLLTERQQNDLDKGIVNYLQSRNLTRSVAAFKEETDFDGTEDPKLDGLLEKKWVAVIRLQKKILELETKIQGLQEELRSNPSTRSASAVTDWVPKQNGSFDLTGHRAPVTRVTFHPTAPLLATASEDFTIKIWDYEGGDLQRTLSGHTREVKDVDFHPQGSFLVSASSDLTIRLWDTEKWDLPGYNGVSLHGHDHTISSARFLPTGAHIVSASRDKTIKVWEMASKFCIRTIQAHNDWVRYVTPSDDGKFLASCSNDHTGRIWDYTTGQMKSELRGHDRQVEVIEFAPTTAYPYLREWLAINDSNDQPGAYAVSGGRDNLLMVWDANSGAHLKTLIGHDGWVRGLAFHPSGKFLLSASDDKTIRVWDLKSGRCTRTIDAHTHFVQSIAWARMKIAPSAGASGAAGKGVNGANSSTEPRIVNVVATGSVDRLVKVWMP